jgi:hypothetical protein
LALLTEKTVPIVDVGRQQKTMIIIEQVVAAAHGTP